jgi:LacI family xylobiose transport system transcriptional regulator
MLSTYKATQVQINPFQHNDGIPCVAGEDYQGAFAMTEYLLSLGHRRISFLTGPRNMRASRDRQSGFLDALKARQVPAEAELIRNSEWTFDGGYTLARQLLELPAPPTAIFAGSDEAAFGVIYAAQEMGLRIPEQLSICGYDDAGLSKNIWPGLTTVHQPAEELVEKATRMLITLLKGKPIDQASVSIASRLVIRGSTGRLLPPASNR